MNRYNRQIKAQAQLRTKIIFLTVILGGLDSVVAISSDTGTADRAVDVQVGRGPSFDCNKAITKVEKTICEHENLSALDRQLNELYKRKVANPNIREDVRKSQLNWLRNERSDCEHIEEIYPNNPEPNRIGCIRSKYLDRIRDVNKILPDLKSFGDACKHNKGISVKTINDNVKSYDMGKYSVEIVQDKMGYSGLRTSKLGEGILVSYKSKSGTWLGLTFPGHELFRFPERKDIYSTGCILRTKRDMELSDNISIRLNMFDHRAHSPCPTMNANYIQFYNGDQELVSEFVLFYKVDKVIKGNTKGCPNEVGNGGYETSYVTVGGGLVEDKVQNRIILKGGREYNYKANILVMMDEVLFPEDFCRDPNLYAVRASLYRSLFFSAGEELDFQKQYKKLQSAIKEERVALCR